MSALVRVVGIEVLKAFSVDPDRRRATIAWQKIDPARDAACWQIHQSPSALQR
jgi:hypothetical protein